MDEIITPDVNARHGGRGHGQQRRGAAARNPQVAMDAAGNFTVVYEAFADHDYGESGSPDSYGIYYRRFDAAGTPMTDEAQQANTVVTSNEDLALEGQATVYFEGDQVNPTIAMDADGDFAIFWNGNGAQPDRLDIANMETVGDTDDAGVFGRWFHAGTATVLSVPTTAQQRANETEAGTQQFASIAMEPDGDSVVAWAGNGVGDRHGIFVRHYNDTTDTAGPMATELRLEDGTRVDWTGVALDVNPQTMLVVFDEELNTAMTGEVDQFGNPTAGLHSVENVDNWTLLGGATVDLAIEMSDTIVDVDFNFDPVLNKWVAAVTFGANGVPTALVSGAYTLVVSESVYDVAGNPLGRTGFTPDGEPASMAFVLDTPPNEEIISDPAQKSYTDAESADAVAVDSDGDYVVAWTVFDAAKGRDRIYFRLFDAEGNAKALPQEVTPDSEALGFELDQQRFAGVAIDADGDFIVTWSNSRDADGIQSTDVFEDADVYARRYDAVGNAVSDPFRVNTTTTNDQKWSSVAMDTDGDFVVTWTSKGQENNGQIGFGYGIYARRYDRFGYALGREFQVNTTTAGDQQLPSVAMDTNGRFVIVWQSDQDGIGEDIVYRAYNADGSPVISPLAGEYLVNGTPEGNQILPDVAVNLSGDTCVFTWSSSQETGDPDDYGVYTKAFNPFLSAQELRLRYSYGGDVIDFDHGETIDVPIEVDQQFLIDDLNVQLWINHEDPSDLFVSLISPSGTEVILFQEVPRDGDASGSTSSGANGQDFEGTILDDEPVPGQEAISITDEENALPPFSGTYTPARVAGGVRRRERAGDLDPADLG